MLVVLCLSCQLSWRCKGYSKGFTFYSSNLFTSTSQTCYGSYLWYLWYILFFIFFSVCLLNSLLIQARKKRKIHGKITFMLNKKSQKKIWKNNSRISKSICVVWVCLSPRSLPVFHRRTNVHIYIQLLLFLLSFVLTSMYSFACFSHWKRKREKCVIHKYIYVEEKPAERKVKGGGGMVNSKKNETRGWKPKPTLMLKENAFVCEWTYNIT